ncbi:uncharacterized protein LOC131858577 [Cryptomeria japonica]|uniref:uncharacterized protein LOC131858577 n=1 Tax=Cryptomeria japonica TaxID=3369 RepID=UPI0027D9DBF1|nr:uncharacterized protein LOC131858577 [Cryptomeria japonica]
MENHWPLKDSGIYVPPSKCVNINSVKWKAPPKDWTKLNFDGASKGNPGESGIGAIIENEHGNIIYGLYGGIGFATNNEAEIRALEVGLCLYTLHGISRIIIEGDLQIIINGVTKSNFHSWKLNKWLPQINDHLKSIDCFEIVHVYREGNQMVDYLANLGVGRNDDPVSFSHVLAMDDITRKCLKDYRESPCQGVG